MRGPPGEDGTAGAAAGAALIAGSGVAGAVDCAKATAGMAMSASVKTASAEKVRVFI